MTMVKRKELERTLKKFNDDEMGGGFIYFIYKQGKEEILVQLDLVDYSSCEVCGSEDIEDFQFIKEEDGIYLKLYEKYKGIDHAWIDYMGVQM
ncbi:aspartate kinase [Clostridium botulinum]|uniref:aspartate kinase n=1 Tax=Clostridium botulinum TaxID=1491 RepID=UPI0013F021C0|nr:aspartate kinase [Clostridium botulinum]MBY6996501.1 aspartate kinase [Clostridium botulinum]MBY7011154.1 aspartate kinase [Clostridium botulinum]MCR1153614.1 aspartate kinase [Clostridium botulinum]MCS6165701.1 aspartate kinase [Clostridium botulinum]NEZ76210.1 aspartate kinase [Clostridium botulinum]